MTGHTKLQATIQIGPPTLRVKDLQQELLFYEDGMGLRVNRRFFNNEELEIVELGFKGNNEKPLLVLKHDPNAKSPPNDFAGLFHFAILVPDRKSLASTLVALTKSGISFDGFADHLVSESLYLHDPKQNGIEIYRDRPKSEWRRDKNGLILMDTLPLDLRSLLADLTDEEKKGAIAFPSGARIGHMHLRVTNLERSLQFYKEKLGLKLTADWSAYGADFVAWADYHHHIGINTWYSLNGKQHANGESGLDQFVITLLRAASLEALKEKVQDSILQTRNGGELLLEDPDGIRIVVSVSS